MNEENKSKYYARGAADAANNVNEPPARGPLGGTFDSKEEWDRDSIRRAEYREGHGDKKREMKQEKK